MNKLDIDYQNLLKDILDNGVNKNDRTGTGTLSVFGRQIRHNMKDGFPLLTTKKMAWKSIVTELLWFLRGDTNIKFLVDNGCHIWDGDAYKRYYTYFDKLGEGIPHTKEEFIDKIKTDEDFEDTWGDLGPIYGKQWRSWNSPETFIGDDSHSWQILKPIDQIANLINELKTNPDSRRLMVSAWNVGELEQMVLPPCHYGFQIYTRELSLEERIEFRKKHTKDGTVDYDNRNHNYLDHFNVPKRAISLMWLQRSVDTGLGLSFNIASYALLLMMIAKQVNMVAEQLIGNLGDVHLYSNHIQPIKEQLTRIPYELPTVKISDRVVNDISEYTLDDIVLENYQYHPTIKMCLSN
jgi:thymidylate synthase